jgi:hypothetical protein
VPLDQYCWLAAHKLVCATNRGFGIGRDWLGKLVNFKPRFKKLNSGDLILVLLKPYLKKATEGRPSTRKTEGA